MIDIRKLKELVRLMVENDLTEMDLRDKDEQVLVKRPGIHAPPSVIVPAHADAPTATHALAKSTAAPSAQATVPAAEDESGLVAIESPMVGTFYASPAPDKPPFVTAGASIHADTVVCLLEAMKIFNEIKAERAGTIARVLVQSGQAVEFGQKLFLVRPA